MSIEEYWTKRHFERTPEPKGGKGKGGGFRFVVQRHQASHLHYDFRLEMDGVLKSWAVPKGVPAEIGVRRLAVQVEDHPIDYVDFAGEIPEGEYGAGIVEIWDKGEYELAKKLPDKLEFTLRGARYSGDYALIHTKGTNWLLFKRKPSPHLA
jgi:DNA ligase D-like protein (predicted 3'-phosphoesterase)